MQLETLYNLHKTTFSIVTLFALKLIKISSVQISTVRKFIAENSVVFANNCNKLCCVNCRAFLTAFFGLFYFFVKYKI